jgi:hypothetical protein
MQPGSRQQNTGGEATLIAGVIRRTACHSGLFALVDISAHRQQQALALLLFLPVASDLSSNTAGVSHVGVSTHEDELSLNRASSLLFFSCSTDCTYLVF